MFIALRVILCLSQHAPLVTEQLQQRTECYSTCGLPLRKYYTAVRVLCQPSFRKKFRHQSAPKMGTANTSEKSANFCQTIRRNNPQGGCLHVKSVFCAFTFGTTPG